MRVVRRCAVIQGESRAPPKYTRSQERHTPAYDGVVFEMEHGPYDIRALRDSLQYLLNRKQIVDLVE